MRGPLQSTKSAILLVRFQVIMSKRLNKRQQREAEELPGLKAQHACVAEVEEGKKAGEDDIEETVVNPFDAVSLPVLTLDNGK